MLKIIGDINFADGYFDQGKGIGSVIKAGANPFEHLNLKNEDFWIGNFECVCADADGEYFVNSPEALKKIRHLDLYGVANNHSMQIGDDGYVQTLDFMSKNDIKYVGSNTKRSTTFTHQGKRIGILAFCMRPDNFTKKPLYWHLPELSDITAEIKNMHDCDFKIAFIHWGYEFINRPNIEQRQMAHWLIDSGIDLVVGMHPHVAQGCESYNGKYIFYSLGNTVFNMAWEPTKYSLMINVDFSDDKPRIWSDYIYIGNDFFPRVMSDVPEPYTRQRLDGLLQEIEENEKYFAKVEQAAVQYRKANRKAVLRRMLGMPMDEKIALIKDFAKRRISKK